MSGEANKKTTIYLPLEGVESEHCALIADKALNGLADVSAHHVELNNHRAVIETTDAAAAVTEAVVAIRSHGYNITTVKKNYPVLGMSCASCAASSESTLKYLPGIVSASVNYANAHAQVEFVPGIADAQKMKAALQAVGYDLAIDESEDAREDIELRLVQQTNKLRQKTWIAVALSVPLMVVSMLFMNMPFANYIMWALATPVLVFCGRQFFTGAWKQARHGSGNMDTLVALSTGVAYVFSVFNTLFPEYWHKRGLHAHVYFEASAVVIAFILLGKLLEDRAKGNTSSAIKKLMGLAPNSATVIRNDIPAELSIKDILPGDTLLVKPGERIAVDGVVSSGHSYVDESMISGEPIPVEKNEGAKVFAGTINQKGSLQFIAEKTGGNTLLAQIIRTVQDAQGSKAPVQHLADKIAAVFVPVVVGIALLSFITWWLVGGDNGFTHGLMAMVTVLVIACPCALGLATPTAIMVGIGKSAEAGILIKDAESLELAKKVNAVVLDKTGTITEGKPSVTDIAWLNNDDSKAHVLIAMEQMSEHPLAEAIVKHFTSTKRAIISGFESIPGSGVKAVAEGETYFAGSMKIPEIASAKKDPIIEKLSARWLQEAKTVVYFADEEKILAAVGIADTIKPSSVTAIIALAEMNIDVYMLTGDNEQTAAAIASQAGIAHYKAGMQPAEKAAFIKKLQADGKTVAMAGDGVNDSTALAQADVSIAMGRGSDIAMEVARMTIISSDLSRIPEAIRLSAMTSSTIRQNLFWAFIYNVIGIPVAAGIFYPVNGFLLSPMIAGAAMAMSSVSVVSNSLRLKFKKIN